MATDRLYAGYALRRLRRQQERTQADMAEELEISPSYLNLLERNQRPVTANLLLRLSDRFDIDLRTLTSDAPGGGLAALQTRLQDPIFADLDIDRDELRDWLEAAPLGVEAFARLFDRSAGDPAAHMGRHAPASDSIRSVREAIERWRNHFPSLEDAAQELADQFRLGGGDIYAAIGDRLRVKHQLSLRILPIDVMPFHLRRLDLHARQLQLSELLDHASRTFQAGFQLAQIEMAGEIDALARGADLADQGAQFLFRRHLAGYFAAALMMPYARFLKACEATGYDLELLARRFGVGFEMLAHRLTTLQRVGERGLPFCMIRIDRAGQVSKSFRSDGKSPLVPGAAGCPLWSLHECFERPGTLLRQTVELEDGTRWFTLSRTVSPHARAPQGVNARFAIGLGLEVQHAAELVHARGIDLAQGEATPIGLGCQNCTRRDCPQRSLPTQGIVPRLDSRERGFSPFSPRRSQ